ncbi:MAG TPA: DUF389 domain-containing protein [Saprospiraceae bacterium]|nr:DUF389 domain-containing protein [Saprospirales bacterium]HRQ28870.1 DUF389 domain-containing protein [Saprospiraceae bacterium]
MELFSGKSHSILHNILHFLNLEADLENPDIIHNEIQKGVTFKGTNLWILMFATIVASVGLNMNSTAVIIGAMLISPLMGPINGMGYSIATFDTELFRLSIKNFSFAVFASLAASTLYFFLSPVSTAHSELLARTSPTIYDVVIALFGGLAGIVAISSRMKGNVIPGVAIATALMPPLCTAGYGLATFQPSFFFGAIYLFTINTIFIALSALWVSQILNFPIRGTIPEKRKKAINNMITVVILIVLIPSIYFGYQLVQQEKFVVNSGKYISNISLFEGNYLLKNDVDKKNKKIRLVYGGTELTNDQKKEIISKAIDFQLGNAKIQIEQGLTFNEGDEATDQALKLKDQISRLSAALRDREAVIDSMKASTELGGLLLKELNILFPQISSCGYTESYIFTASDHKPQKQAVIMISLSSPLKNGEKEKVKGFLKERLASGNIKVIYDTNED